MNTRHYASVFDDAVSIMWTRIRGRAGLGSFGTVVPVTAETRTSFVMEAAMGMILEVNGCVGRVGTKSVGLSFALSNPLSGQVHARCEVVEVFFDKQTRSSRPIPDELRDHLNALAR